MFINMFKSFLRLKTNYIAKLLSVLLVIVFEA